MYATTGLLMCTSVLDEVNTLLFFSLHNYYFFLFVFSTKTTPRTPWSGAVPCYYYIILYYIKATATLFFVSIWWETIRQLIFIRSNIPEWYIFEFERWIPDVTSGSFNELHELRTQKTTWSKYSRHTCTSWTLTLSPWKCARAGVLSPGQTCEKPSMQEEQGALAVSHLSDSTVDQGGVSTKATSHQWDTLWKQTSKVTSWRNHPTRLQYVIFKQRCCKRSSFRTTFSSLFSPASPSWFQLCRKWRYTVTVKSPGWDNTAHCDAQTEWNPCRWGEHGTHKGWGSPRAFRISLLHLEVLRASSQDCAKCEFTLAEFVMPSSASSIRWWPSVSQALHTTCRPPAGDETVDRALTKTSTGLPEDTWRSAAATSQTPRLFSPPSPLTCWSSGSRCGWERCSWALPGEASRPTRSWHSRCSWSPSCCGLCCDGSQTPSLPAGGATERELNC